MHPGPTDPDGRRRPCPHRPARIVLVEDHPMVMEAVRAVLQSASDLQVTATASSAEEALQLAELAEADLVLIDATLPQMSGVQLTRELGARHPGVRCLVLSGHREPAYVEAALAAGARGYLAKDSPIELVTAVRRVLAGEIYLGGSVRGSGG